MYLIGPSLVPELDAYASERFGISPVRLMGNAGHALAKAVAARVSEGSKILIFAGPGNNGGDGYAAGALLHELGYTVRILDVMGTGQHSAAGKYYESLFNRLSGDAVTLSEVPEEILEEEINRCGAVLDAIFGTGARTGLPPEISALLTLLNRAPAGVLRVAADVPTGIDACDGRVGETAFRADLTVTFAFAKRGMYAYPARGFCGEILSDPIGLDRELLAEHFSLRDRLLDGELCASILPARQRNTHKGTFGRLTLLCGSAAYRGAAALAGAAAMRAGAGLVTLASQEAVLDLALAGSPELIGFPIPEFEKLDRDKTAKVLLLADKSDALLIGCGSGNTIALCCFIWELLTLPGCPLIIDADGINALSQHREESLVRLKTAKRQILLMPHPLEFSRLSGVPVSEIQADRIGSAVRFASAENLTLILKGAGTVIAGADGTVFVNSTGGPALSKGGSGDVLAGAVAAFVAQKIEPAYAAALAVYLHGRAGDILTEEYSEYGVLPGDLPPQIAREIRVLENLRRKPAQ